MNEVGTPLVGDCSAQQPPDVSAYKTVPRALFVVMFCHSSPRELSPKLLVLFNLYSSGIQFESQWKHLSSWSRCSAVFLPSSGRMSRISKQATTASFFTSIHCS